MLEITSSLLEASKERSSILIITSDKFSGVVLMFKCKSSWSEIQVKIEFVTTD